MATQIVLAGYRPNEGKENELLELVKKHVPTLRELELITDRQALTMKSKDGTIIEVIEWNDVSSADRAHEHPAVAKIWESMAAISKFVPMAELTEAEKAFSHYEVVTI